MADNEKKTVRKRGVKKAARLMADYMEAKTKQIVPAKIPRIPRTKRARAKKIVPVDPLQVIDQIKEFNGLDVLEREGQVLQLDWAIRFPLLKPFEYLVAERGYSTKQASTILRETGGEDDWVLRRTEIQNKVTETVVKRHVDQIADFNETFIKASKVGLAKSLEMMTKLSLDPVKDEDGKLIIDPKTKRPVYRGFRSIDLLNVLNSVKIAQEIWRKSMGIDNNEGGMAQVLEKVEQMNKESRVQINQTLNLTMNPAKKEAEQKLEGFVRDMSYEDIRAFVDYHRKKTDIVDAEYYEEKDE